MTVMEKRQMKLGAQDYLGWTLWIIGFATEVIADHQKGQFRADPLNKETFIKTGLWSLSRHPNYFGEILLWFGLFISASSNFTKWWQYLSILSPTAVYLLITKMSGIPLLEQHGLKNWGHLPEYQTYLNNTPELIPQLSGLLAFIGL
jgi:steroid 5-alpha reductase family enzyme